MPYARRSRVRPLCNLAFLASIHVQERLQELQAHENELQQQLAQECARGGALASELATERELTKQLKKQLDEERSKVGCCSDKSICRKPLLTPLDRAPQASLQLTEARAGAARAAEAHEAAAEQARVLQSRMEEQEQAHKSQLWAQEQAHTSQLQAQEQAHTSQLQAQEQAHKSKARPGPSGVHEGVVWLHTEQAESGPRHPGQCLLPDAIRRLRS